MKKTNLRLDLITKKQLSKNQLHRLVYYNNQLILDNDQTIKARGVYFNKESKLIIDKKTKALIQRNLRVKISEEQFEIFNNALNKRGQYEEKTSK
ncbi:DUF448 domain-containing protein [Mycoplasma sp. E35C]|uniref:DUF448 domain-containing protein n=1 Tax=Mycoplasma sp. E35C TaxID=2801918 RepID=UPI001CA42081|nr:DUF448 domain-containing protein [Mycoplasma sp. E35C]QZX49231.1 DUF448 domain-containing protein [Mycoplasma sp. E35C]